MKRKEIKEAVSKDVWEWYDRDTRTLESVMPLTEDTCAVIEKEFDGEPVCHVFFNDDDTVERDLPRVCEMIEREAREAVTDIDGQTAFQGYEDAAPCTCVKDHWTGLPFKGTRETY